MSTSGYDSNSKNADALASLYSGVQDQRAQLAQYAIAKAASYMQSKRNDEAIREFKKALAFDPQNATAHTYLGKIYQSKGNLRDAIREFKSVAEADRTSVTARNNLGSAYMQDKQYAAAEKEYKAAARMDPLNPLADYSLGLLYTQTGRFNEAEAQYKKVARISPKDGNVPYSLGVLYNKTGRPEEAVTQLKKALTLKKDYAAANYELGAAYVSLGNSEKAREQLSILENKDTALAEDLRFLLDTPKMAFMDQAKSKRFNQLLGPGTPLWMLDPTMLSAAGSSAKATVAITFTNDMDVASVMNPANWQISRAKSAEGGYYNNTMPVGSQEVSISKRPFSVSYDPTTRTASVVIALQQNSMTSSVSQQTVTTTTTESIGSGSAVTISSNSLANTAYSGPTVTARQSMTATASISTTPGLTATVLTDAHAQGATVTIRNLTTGKGTATATSFSGDSLSVLMSGSVGNNPNYQFAAGDLLQITAASASPLSVLQRTFATSHTAAELSGAVIRVNGTQMTEGAAADYTLVTRSDGSGYSDIIFNTGKAPAAGASITADFTTTSTTNVVTQSGTATIDPKHLVFSFSGRDAAGRQMDPAADQIDGYSITPF